MFPSQALIPLVLSKFLVKYIISQFRFLILVVPWLPTILNMLEDVPHHCPVIKDLVMDVSVGPVAQGSAVAAFNPLAVQGCVLHRQGSHLSGSGEGNSSVYNTGRPAVLHWLDTQLVFTIQLYLPFWNCIFFIKL